MPSQAVLDAAARRKASGASTVDTAKTGTTGLTNTSPSAGKPVNSIVQQAAANRAASGASTVDTSKKGQTSNTIQVTNTSPSTPSGAPSQVQIGPVSNAAKYDVSKDPNVFTGAPGQNAQDYQFGVPEQPGVLYSTKESALAARAKILADLAAQPKNLRGTALENSLSKSQSSTTSGAGVNVKSTSVNSTESSGPAPFNAGQGGTSAAQNPDSPAGQNISAEQLGSPPQSDPMMVPQMSWTPEFQEFLNEYEDQTQTNIDRDHPDFLKLAADHQYDTKSWNNIVRRFALPKQLGKPIVSPGNAPAPAAPIKMKETSGDSNFQYFEEIDNHPGSTNITTVLDEEDQKSFEDQLNDLMNAPDNISGIGLIKLALKVKLAAIDDPRITEFLDEQEQRATSSYQAGLAFAEKSTTEINKAIEGTLVTPETESGLQAKILIEGKNLQEDVIEEQIDYEKSIYDVSMQKLRQNRADLEGYTKAKLYSMGAQDSSAGISLLSKVLNEADMNITMAETEHTHSLRQLSFKGQEIILNYTNEMAKLAQGVMKYKEDALGDYNEKLDEIDKDRFTNATQKRKDGLAAIGDYIKDVQKFEEQSKEDARNRMKDYYDQIKDARDEAYKLSGLTGTVYVADQNGKLVNTGVPTFAANKFVSTEQRLANSEARQQANVLLDTYGSAASPYVEQLLGLPEGSLRGLKTVAEKKKAISSLGTSSAVEVWGQDNKSAEQNDNKFQQYLDKFGPGVVRQNGIGIDPLSIPDVRDVIANMSRITQKFHKPHTGGAWKDGSHDGIDVVFNDGYVHAVRSGTVVQVIPWDGKNPYGNRVIIEDEQGLLWQYGHMGKKGGGDPFMVSVGDYVGAEDQLGFQGRTGVATGVHAHIGIVGGRIYEAITHPVESLQKVGDIFNDVMWGGEDDVIQNAPKDTNEFKERYYFEFGKMPTKADITAYNTYGPRAWQKMVEMHESQKKSSKTTVSEAASNSIDVNTIDFGD